MKRWEEKYKMQLNSVKVLCHSNRKVNVLLESLNVASGALCFHGTQFEYH
jgi:hypothetical protein